MAIGSVERVRQALVDLGHADTVAEFPDGTRTAADAAAHDEDIYMFDHKTPDGMPARPAGKRLL